MLGSPGRDARGRVRQDGRVPARRPGADASGLAKEIHSALFTGLHRRRRARAMACPARVLWRSRHATGRDRQRHLAVAQRSSGPRRGWARRSPAPPCLVESAAAALPAGGSGTNEKKRLSFLFCILNAASAFPARVASVSLGRFALCGGGEGLSMPSRGGLPAARGEFPLTVLTGPVFSGSLNPALLAGKMHRKHPPGLSFPAGWGVSSKFAGSS